MVRGWRNWGGLRGRDYLHELAAGRQSVGAFHNMRQSAASHQETEPAGGGDYKGQAMASTRACLSRHGG